MIKQVVIQQFGGWWRLSLDQWIGLCQRAALTGEGYDLSEWAPQLKRKPAVIAATRYEGGRWDYHSTREDVLYVEPLDWTRADFERQLQEIDAMFLAPAMAKLGAFERALDAREPTQEAHDA